MSEKIAIGCDHRGYTAKEALKTVLAALNKKVVDKGAFSEEAADYPEYAQKVARAVSKGECSRGVLICGSGIGMSIAANKFPGVRAALCHDINTAVMSRKHNDANILVIAGAAGPESVREMLEVWLQTSFEGGRHQKRVDLIKLIESENFKETR